MHPLVDAAILGAVQGATEFLPVSSSAHLVLGSAILGGFRGDLVFDVSVHLGTLAAVLVVFRREIASLVRQPILALADRAAWSGPTRLLTTYPALRLWLLIVVASIPTAGIGMAFKDQFERLFSSVPAVGAALCVTGLLLAATRLVRPGDRDLLRMTLGAAFLIGVAQGLAITPGISRSGATICTALYLGTDRDLAGRFSFLLSIPAILGAEVLSILDAGGIVPGAALALVVGALAAAGVGYLALRLLLAFVRRGKIHYFAPYCFLLGGGVLAYTMLS